MLQNTSLPHYKGFVKGKKNPFHCLRLDALCDWFIFVFYVGTFPSVRDLSLGKSLRVKRHDWLAELIQRKFFLLARNLC